MRCLANSALATAVVVPSVLGARATPCFAFDELATNTSLAPRGFSFDVLAAAADTLPSSGHALAAAADDALPYGLAFDVLATAANVLPSIGHALAAATDDTLTSTGPALAAVANVLPAIGRAPQHFLSDNGASANITSSYHGEIPGSRRPTEVPQGFKQGSGKLTCDTTFLARHDLAGMQSPHILNTRNGSLI